MSTAFLEFVRLESGKIQYEDEECDIIQLCSEVLDKVNGREESTVSVSLQTDLKEQLARTDEVVRYIACQHADSVRE